MTMLFSFSNLNLAFGNKVIFNNAQMSFLKGDKVGLLGLNGQGKSTLLKILNQETKPDISEPPFKIDKTNFQESGKNTLSFFLIPQEMPFNDHNIDTNINNYIFTFYPELEEINNKLEKINHLLSSDITEKEMNSLLNEQTSLSDQFEHLKGWELINSYQSYLKLFGIEELEQRVKDLSGGEQKKILLSLGLSSQHDIILWDEPTNHLDLETIEIFENELQTTNSNFIIITHDRYLLTKICNKIIQIENGQINSFKGNYAEYLEFLSEKEKTRIKHLDKLQNQLRREDAWMKQGIKARGTRSKKRVENFHDIKESISNLKSQTKKKISLKINESNKKSKIIFRIKNGQFRYEGARPMFKEINLEIYKGDKIGLIGPNGAGKTTLLKLLTEELKISSGERYEADDLKIRIFEQKREELNHYSTPFEFLGEGNDFIHLPNGQELHIAAYFEKFLFNRDDLHRPLKFFSGGEKNRLLLAKNLSKEGDIWIFDEPTNDLDLESLEVLEQTLSEFKGSVIVISHDRSFLENVTNKIWFLNNQEIEKFNAGLDQVLPYIKAIQLEKDLEKEHQENNHNDQLEKNYQTEPDLSPAKKKLSNKEKIRLRELPNLIQKLENQVEKLCQAIEKISKDEISSDELHLLNKNTQDKHILEEELILLYEELEELSGP